MDTILPDGTDEGKGLDSLQSLNRGGFPMTMLRSLLTLILVLGACLSARAEPPVGDDRTTDWPEVTATSRPWAYWWWMGSAVDRDNLSRELHRYRDAGLGGVHIIPIYGAKGYEDKSIEYLSPRWMEMLGTTVAEARKLGLDVDMTLGTGWCFGGPNISERDANARVVARAIEVPAGGRLKERFDRRATQALVATSATGKTLDLLWRIDPDGSVDWVASPDGPWKVFAISQRFSGQKVKRPSPGGEGPMLNPFFEEAIKHYLTRFTDAFATYDGPMPRAIYQDSYEYQSDWSPDFFDQFQRRRGYRLQDHLPLMFGGTDDRAARVKHDYRETVSDLMVESATPAWVAWGHDRKLLTRNEAHGSPGNLLDLYAAADVPEAEFFSKDRNPLVAKLASSAAHVANHRLVSSETGTWLAEHFHETLDELKRLVDEFFVSGINHVFYHGTCYSPDEAPWPGWLFYASTEMNPRNAIWRDVPTLNAYIARCQAVLQAGQPDNDILLYWPIADLWHDPRGLVQPLAIHHDAWLTGQPVGRAAKRLWERGFSFDYISDRQLTHALPDFSGVETPHATFRAVVVPACDHMPLTTLEKLLDLAQWVHTTVIFQDRLPGDVPGLGDLDGRREAFRKRLDGLPLQDVEGGLKEARLRNGRILVGNLDEALARARVARESMVDHAGVRFIRRNGNDRGLAFMHSGFSSAASDARPRRHYFIVNQGEGPLEGWVTLSTPAASITALDPMTGRVGTCATRLVEGLGMLTQVYLQLQPGESIILRTSADRKAAGPDWPYSKPSGSPVALKGTWRVTFVQGGPELPKPFETDSLASWTTLGDDEARRFAGTARYALTFDAPAGSADRWWLDLGKVCQSARIRLNDRNLGTRIMAPYRVEVDGLKPTGNVLEVEVTNLSANRIRDLDRRGVVWKTFKDINIVNINYKPFDASDWPLADSGLLGPVMLTPIRPAAPEY